jgi:hypothetical protein
MEGLYGNIKSRIVVDIYKILWNFALYQCTWKPGGQGQDYSLSHHPFVDWILQAQIVDNKYLLVFHHRCIGVAGCSQLLTVCSSLLTFKFEELTMPPITAPLEGSRFQLNASGVAGFFGGKEAVSAMATVHVYEGRKWFGWYNSPGSYIVAKKYGRLAHARLWTALFPGVSTDPATLFGMKGKSGPEFVAVQSGTNLSDTGQIGYIFLKKCQALETKKIESRTTTPHTISIADLGEKMPPIDINVVSPRGLESYTLLGVFPIFISVGACIGCGVVRDWYCFSMILLGILSNGISCLVIGSGVLEFTHPNPAKGSPKGDGFLQSQSSPEFVVLRGAEGAVNSITRGAFSLKFAGEPEYRAIGISALLLTTQFLLQLLLIPQGILFGQVMFLCSLGVSWAYNCYLSSVDLEKIQGEILTKKVFDEPVMSRYQLGTRTAAVVFLVLALQSPDPRKMFDKLLPNTATWMLWKQVVGRKIKNKENFVFEESDFRDVASEEKGLLEILFSDATEAYNGYLTSTINMEGSSSHNEKDQDSTRS